MFKEKLQEIDKKKATIFTICLIVSAVCMIFSYGSYVFPLCAWIWPALLIWFGRNTRAIVAIPIILLVMLLSVCISWWIPGQFMFGSFEVEFNASLVVTIFIFLPFLADCLLYKKLTENQALFLFPCFWVTMEIILTLTPFGMSISLAYSQRDFLPILQNISVIGTHGLLFVICLFATCSNLFVKKFIENNKTIEWKSVEWKSVACFALVIVMIIGGGIRMATDNITDERVSVATFSGPYVELSYEKNVDSFLGCIEQIDEYRQSGVEVDMVCTSETAYYITESKYEDFLKLVEDVAAEKDLDILFGYMLMTDDDTPKRLSNCCDFVTSDGGYQWTYIKSKLVPFVEDDILVRGNSKTYFTDTQFGRISSVICYDLEFPHIAGNVNVHTDIMLAPSYDWYGLETWHTRNNSFRAIENGYNMVKSTGCGTTGYYDWQGHEIASFTNLDINEYPVFVQSIPTHGAVTFYGQYGFLVDFIFTFGIIFVFASNIIDFTKKKLGINQSS